jgi:CheY-like chemotaxis protein
VGATSFVSQSSKDLEDDDNDEFINHQIDIVQLHQRVVSNHKPRKLRILVANDNSF